jgi:hypothetical protein
MEEEGRDDDEDDEGCRGGEDGGEDEDEDECRRFPRTEEIEAVCLSLPLPLSASPFTREEVPVVVVVVGELYPLSSPPAPSSFPSNSSPHESNSLSTNPLTMSKFPSPPLIATITALLPSKRGSAPTERRKWMSGMLRERTARVRA